MEAITGEHGVIAHKTKEYKVKWQDYSEETWIDYTEIDKKCQPWLEAQERPSSQHSQHINTGSRLLAMPADTMIAQICKEAGVAEAAVLFVYAGVPCETYSIAGRTNKGRDLHKTAHGYNVRLTDAERSPCYPEQSGCPYGDEARLHDGIVKHVLHALQTGYTRGFRYGIENPDGELKYQPFMSEEQWPTGLSRAYKPFHCCAVGHSAKKPM